MITTLTGNNSFDIRRRLNKLVADFAKENGELAIERLDGEETQTQAVLSAVSSPPFLAKQKLIIIRNLSGNKDSADNIEQIISSISTSVNVIFYEPNIDKRTVYYKALKAKTEFNEINELDERSLPKWLVETANSLDGSIGLSDAVYLVSRLGSNQQLLATELAKLITYEPRVSRESIDLLTEKTPQSKVFDLLDASFSGNKARALTLYEEQRAQKVEPQEIVSMLAWQLRLITYAKLGQGKSTDNIAADSGTSSYPVGKAQALASKIDQKKLRQLVEQAEEIDKLSKTKAIDLDEALKTYIVSVL